VECFRCILEAPVPNHPARAVFGAGYRRSLFNCCSNKVHWEAEVILDTHKIQLSEQQQTILSDVATVDPVTVDTQTEILKSAGLARSVIRDLHLIGDPEFTGEKGALRTQ